MIADIFKNDIQVKRLNKGKHLNNGQVSRVTNAQVTEERWLQINFVEFNGRT